MKQTPPLAILLAYVAFAAPAFAAGANDETRAVQVGEGHPKEIVNYATPTGSDTGTKRLELTGVISGVTNRTMTSSINAGVYDSIQWTSVSKVNLLHIYEIVNAGSKTPLTMVVGGDVRGDIQITGSGGGGGSGKKIRPYTATVPPEATVTSATQLVAPDRFLVSPPNSPGTPAAGTPNTRLAVAPGERIDFDVGHTHLGYPDVSISSDAGQLYVLGKPGSQQLFAANKFTFAAEDKPGSYTLTLHFHEQGKVALNGTGGYGAQDMKVLITIATPTERVVKVGPLPSAPAGEPGVMMELRYTAYPRSVNFSNVEVKEIDTGSDGDPKQPITNYFVDLLNKANAIGAPGILRHKATDHWIVYDNDTNQWSDSAGWKGISNVTSLTPQQQSDLLAVPKRPGTFQWYIPVRWRITGRNSNGHEMYTRVQIFEMQNAWGGMRTAKNDSYGHFEYETRQP